MNHCLPLALFGIAAIAAPPVGNRVPDLKLERNGQAVTVPSAAGRPTAVIFVSTRCPISNAYQERMNAIYRDYTPKDVNFVFVNSNFNESAEEIASHSKDNQLAFPVHRDPSGSAAGLLGAEFTPEVFLLNGTGALVYHGYIDDSRNQARVQVHGLRNALDAVLAGQPVRVAETKAFGCTIKRQKR